MRSYLTSRIARRALGVGVLAALTAAAACADNLRVASTAADTTATRHLKTFIVMAPPPRVSSAAGAVTDGDGNAATAVMDLWGILRQRLFGIALTNYGLVGRWLAYLPRGRFRHNPIAKSPPVQGEQSIGWVAHYLIGVGFADIDLKRIPEVRSRIPALNHRRPIPEAVTL